MTHQELEAVRDFFKNDSFAALSGFNIESAGDSQAVCSCKIDGRHINANGAVMGGVYFALGDFTFAVATNYSAALGGNEPMTVAVSNTIQYLRGMTQGILYARAVPLKRGRSMSFYRVDITDGQGVLVAQMNCTGCAAS